MLSVGVFVDLPLHPEAGGHVKCWQRFGEAAAALGNQLNLTLHFLGDREARIQIADNVDYVLHPPRFSTHCLPLLQDKTDQTDLAPLNPKLFPYLEKYDVIHTTHQLFTFSKTALKFCQRFNKPLVSSIHTNVPQYTEIYITQMIQKLPGQPWTQQLLQEKLKVPQRWRQRMQRQLDQYWLSCQRVIVSQPEEWTQVARVIPTSQISHLRRGIDKTLFHPQLRDRQKLAQIYGIPPDKIVLLFVGKLNPYKNVMIVAQAVRQLLAQGWNVHALFLGEGISAAEIQQLLGTAATLPGVVPYANLPWIYASADLFVFPSETETFGNVVVEAKASGLPVIIAAQGGVTQLLQTEGGDGLKVSRTHPQEWAEAIAGLLGQPAKLTAMGRAARQHIETAWPSWQDVLEQDLLPVWQAVAHPGTFRTKRRTPGLLAQ